MHLTPYLLFQYLAAVAGGLFLIGLAAFLVLLLAAAVVGWTRKTSAPSA